MEQELGALNIGDGPALIAVVGVTGSGKSSFIKTVTGQDDIKIGHGQCSETSSVQEYPFSIGGIKVQLIDTPGFDDTDLDDEEIYLKLAEWLEKSYRKGRRLNGMLYLHRITATREKGSDMRNLRMYKKLCGDDNFCNVILGTTFWDQEDEEIAKSREKILVSTPQFWGDMVARGSQLVRVPHQDVEASKSIVLRLARKQKKTLQFQQEVADRNIPLQQSSAAAELENYDQKKAIRDAEIFEKAAQQHRYAEESRRRQEAAAQLKQQQAKFFQEQMRLQNLEAESLAEQKRFDAKAKQLRFELQLRQKQELERQQREIAEKEEAARKARLEAEKARQEQLSSTRARDITLQAQVHFERIQSQEALIGKYVQAGRVFERAEFMAPGFGDLCFKQLSAVEPLRQYARNATSGGPKTPILQSASATKPNGRLVSIQRLTEAWMKSQRFKAHGAAAIEKRMMWDTVSDATFAVNNQGLYISTAAPATPITSTFVYHAGSNGGRRVATVLTNCGLGTGPQNLQGVGVSIPGQLSNDQNTVTKSNDVAEVQS